MVNTQDQSTVMEKLTREFVLPRSILSVTFTHLNFLSKERGVLKIKDKRPIKTFSHNECPETIDVAIYSNKSPKSLRTKVHWVSLRQHTMGIRICLHICTSMYAHICIPYILKSPKVNKGQAIGSFLGLSSTSLMRKKVIRNMVLIGIFNRVIITVGLGGKITQGVTTTFVCPMDVKRLYLKLLSSMVLLLLMESDFD